MEGMSRARGDWLLDVRQEPGRGGAQTTTHHVCCQFFVEKNRLFYDVHDCHTQS